MSNITELLFRLKVNGDCCWKIYNSRNFQGQSQTLYPGFESFLGGNNFRHVKSVKKIECWFAFLCKIKYLSENYVEHNQNVRMYPVLDYSIFPTTTKVRHEIHIVESFVLLVAWDWKLIWENPKFIGIRWQI